MSQFISTLLAALVTGLFALMVYFHQKSSFKRDAALLILQEIRFAEAQVKKYNPTVGFQFYEKLLPTDNWNKNIHLFVNDFEESQIDAISLFYAKTHYLDDVITKFSELVLTNKLVPTINVIQNNAASNQSPIVPVRIPAQDLLDGVVFGLKMELIHNSAVGQRLRNLSKRKHWYSI